MAYTSDLRMKNLIKDIHIKAVKELKKKGIKNKLFLRIFDESSEDNKLWENEGLTFKDKKTGLKHGSNDCAWYVKDNDIAIPLIVVEGTFGTERGQFGDGQHNRFSHALGAVKHGCIGILLCPFVGESFVKDKGSSECKSDIACMQLAYVRKTIVKAAIEASKKEDGEYLVMDPYEKKNLKRLVMDATLNYYGLPNEYDSIISLIKKNMEKYVKGYDLATRSLQLVTKFYNLKEELITNGVGRIFTHNYEALTTATKRDAHGLVGKILIQYYLTEKERVYCFFIRLTKEDVRRLNMKKSKEWRFLSDDPRYIVLSIDDLKFKNKYLKSRLRKIMEQNLHVRSEKGLIKEIKNAFENKGILISN